MQSQDIKEDSADAVATLKPLQIRGRFFTAVALRLEGTPDPAFYAALDEKLQQTPQFFADAPLVIDLEMAAGSLAHRHDMLRLVEGLKSRKLSAFGVQNGTPEQTAAAVSAGLISLSGGRDAPLRGTRRDQKTTVERPAEPLPPANVVVRDPVRSGQTVIAERGDLIVIGPVSAGAELVATGNIHVYGPLRGRAMAGVNGDESARIFCQSLDAELLAIAGLYLTSEILGTELRKRSVQVFLADERLRVEPL